MTKRRMMMNKNDLIKRIQTLDTQLKNEKNLVEAKLVLITNLCNELVSLKTQLEKIENEQQDK